MADGRRSEVDAQIDELLSVGVHHLYERRLDEAIEQFTEVLLHHRNNMYALAYLERSWAAKNGQIPLPVDGGPLLEPSLEQAGIALPDALRDDRGGEPATEPVREEAPATAEPATEAAAAATEPVREEAPATAEPTTEAAAAAAEPVREEVPASAEPSTEAAAAAAEPVREDTPASAEPTTAAPAPEAPASAAEFPEPAADAFPTLAPGIASAPVPGVAPAAPAPAPAPAPASPALAPVPAAAPSARAPGQIGPPPLTPDDVIERLLPPEAEGRLNLDSLSAFVFAQVDGQRTVQQVADVCLLGAQQVLAILREMHMQGAVCRR